MGTKLIAVSLFRFLSYRVYVVCPPRYLHLIQSRIRGYQGWLLARDRRANAPYLRSPLVTDGPQSGHVRLSCAADREACKRISRESSIRSIRLSRHCLLASFSRRTFRHEHRPTRAAPNEPCLFSRSRLVHSIPLPSPCQPSSSLAGDKRRLNTSRISAQCRSRSRNARKRSRATGEKLDRSWYGYVHIHEFTRIPTYTHIFSHLDPCAAIHTTIAVRICMHAAPRSFRGNISVHRVSNAVSYGRKKIAAYENLLDSGRIGSSFEIFAKISHCHASMYSSNAHLLFWRSCSEFLLCMNLYYDTKSLS